MAHTGWVWALIGIAAGCGGVLRGRRPPPVSPPPPPVVQSMAPRPQPQAAPASPLYALDEVIADALSGPLQYIGTGPWYGIQRAHACAYRNARVVLVDVYCTIKESKALRIDVYSPTRGRGRLYAEAAAPVSQLGRGGYFTFIGEAQPPPAADAWLPPVTLTMSLPELQAYERQRYQRFLPTCYGGVEVHRPQGGCLGELAPQARAWKRKNQAFLDQPPEDWYRLVKQLRALAAQHGRDL